MLWQAMFKGSYLAAVEFGNRQFTAEIESVKLVKLEAEDGSQKDKGVVYFKGHDRGWVLCKTNAMCVAAMFGDDTSAWVGKSVTLYSTMVQVGREKKPGIRVKGSPDLSAPVQCEVRLPRKKPFKVPLVPTGKAPPPPKPVEDEPPPDDSSPADEHIEF